MVVEHVSGSKQPQTTQLTEDLKKPTIKISGTSASITLTEFGLPITITGVLSQEQTNQLKGQGLDKPESIMNFLALMGVTKDTIKTLQEMGVTEFTKAANGEVSLSINARNPVKATQFMSFLTANQQLCRDILSKIFNMVGEAKHEAVERFVKAIEESSAKDKENLKEMAKNKQKQILEKKYLDKKLEEVVQNKILNSIIVAIRNGQPLTADQLKEGFTQLQSLGLHLKDDVLDLLVNEQIANSDNNLSPGPKEVKNTAPKLVDAAMRTVLGLA